MKIPGGRTRSAKRISLADQALERLIGRSKRVNDDVTVFEERETPIVQHIASKHAHRGRGSNPYAP